MTISAIVLGAMGIVLSFVPGEVLRFLKWSESSPILVQMLGALYFAFALFFGWVLFTNPALTKKAM